MNNKVTKIVAKIIIGKHEGRYGIVYEYGGGTITFSLEPPVWKGEGSTNLMRGDWVTLGNIKMHGNPPKKRAGSARLAIEEEIMQY
ncbi:MAG: hypothetical protein ABIH79_01140 [archaeon]